MRRVGIFGGSFNPVHLGHTMLAAYMAEFAGFDEVWLTLTPLNPLKVGNGASMASDVDRLAMLKIAVEGCERLKVCDIELSLPKPNYTINTLAALSERNPDCRFTPIVGSDNWEVFDRWKAHGEILERFGIVVYPRPGHDVDHLTMPRNCRLVDAPRIDLSSTFVRESIAQGHDMSLFLPHGVGRYIDSHNLYRTAEQHGTK